MKRKIKLTEKDLKLNISKNSNFNSMSSGKPDTKVTNCPATSYANECPATTENLDCRTTTLGLECPTATFNVVCLTVEETCNCAGSQDCETPSDNCAEPLTDATQCGGCQSNNCNQTNTCNCGDDTKYCFNTEACIEPATAESECHVCGTLDDCVVSYDCDETEVCMLSEDGDCGESVITCMFSENTCEEPNTLIVDCESAAYNCSPTFNCLVTKICGDD